MYEPLRVPGGSYYAEDFIKYTVINLSSGILLLTP